MNFIKFQKLYFAISLFFIIPGVISLLLFGLKPAIDFTGGSLLEVQVTPQAATAEQMTLSKIEAEASQTYEVVSSKQLSTDTFSIRGKTITNDQKLKFYDDLSTLGYSVNEQRFYTVGPTFGGEVLTKMITAVAIVSFMITLYVWYQFNELKYGVSAILAMFHDSLILLGSFSLMGYFLGVEVDVLFVTALLTTLSFSVHDTIVVYDRIRELSRKYAKYSYPQIVNTAIVETLGRSLNNSITIIIMLAALVVIGGETIRMFAVALLIGAITGTYSSTFTAAPLLLLWDEIKAKNIKFKLWF